MSDYYEVKVKGYLDERWSGWFAGLQLSHLDGDETLLHGTLPDQTALHGLLERVRDLNLTLISVICRQRPSTQPLAKGGSFMKTLIVSYSRTGNNEGLATHLAAALEADHLRVTETKKRKMGTIVWDVMLKRVPKIEMPVIADGTHDLVLFVGPVWMGHIASPFRACFEQLRDRIGDYGYVSISGGADGPNPDLEAELTARLGREPRCLVDLHVADLLPSEPAPTRQDTMSYRLTEDEVVSVTESALSALHAALAG